MLFYFWFIDVMLIVFEQFSEVFTQEDFQNVLYYERSVSKNIRCFRGRKPPNLYFSIISHKFKVVKVFEDVIGIFPKFLYI